jgi:mRNA interferase HigB
MRIIAVRSLRNYAQKKKETKQPLFLWYNEACQASWKSSNELKAQFRNASVISGKRIVFNIHGNKYRLIVDIEFSLQIIFIVWMGTHAEYDKIDAKTVVYDKTR